MLEVWRSKFHMRLWEVYGELCHCERKHSHTGVLADADSIPARTSSPPRLSHFVFVISYSSAVPPSRALIDTATHPPCAFTSCYRSSFDPSSSPSLLSYTRLRRTTAQHPHDASPLSSSATSVDVVSPSTRPPLRAQR